MGLTQTTRRSTQTIPMLKSIPLGGPYVHDVDHGMKSLNDGSLVIRMTPLITVREQRLSVALLVFP